MTDLANWRTRADRLLADLRHADRVVAEESENLTRLRNRHAAAVQAQVVVQELAQAAQATAHAQISAVVTRCLKAVFGEEGYEFKIDFERKRGKTEARLLFLRNGHEVDPVNAAGGGCVHVAAFALRVACLLLATPRRRRVLILDEPMAFPDNTLAPRIRELFLTLTEQLDFQLIFSTHKKQLVCGKVIRIGEGD